MIEIISTDKAPAPVGPYSQAIKASGKFLFTAGQVALDPISGQIVGTTAAEQAEQVMKNLLSILRAAETSFAEVVKTTIFLKDMNHFGEVNQVYGKYFTGAPPARSTVEVSRLPKDVLVEIECIACLG